MDILVVEDNSIIAFELKSNIEQMGHNVVATASTAIGAIEAAKKHEPELAMLDINLKGDKDGVYVAKEFEKLGLPFIFLTSYYDESTLEKVKETNFAAFIPKPYTELDLRLNIELAQRKTVTTDENKTHRTDFFVYLDNKVKRKIQYDDIEYIKADDNYSVFYTKLKKVLVRMPMKNLDEKLRDPRFFRIHRSVMINTDKIQSFSNNTVIISEESLPISGSRRKEFKNHLKVYWR